jgi:hypothetical protein
MTGPLPGLTSPVWRRPRPSIPRARANQAGLSAVAGVPELAEGEGVGLDAGVEEGSLQGAVADGTGLADELVEPRLGDRAVALVVNVGAMGGARGLAVEQHPEPYR